MKLATLTNGKLDGELVVVSRDLSRMARVTHVAATLQSALEDWPRASTELEAVYRDLNSSEEGEPFSAVRSRAPLPRAYQWCDGSLFEAHMQRMMKWMGKSVNPRFYSEPTIVYQGASDAFLDPTGPILCADEAWGVDYEGEIAVVTTSVDYGTSAESAGDKVALVILANDVSLRNLIPAELAKGFGFVQAKPSTTFAPIAVTPDELGDGWRAGRLHARLVASLNGSVVTDADTGAMVLGFHDLIAYIAKTRPLAAGTIIGSGTVSGHDPIHGMGCLAERRAVETALNGEATTPYMEFGDRIRIEVFGDAGATIFGAIDQVLVPTSTAPPGRSFQDITRAGELMTIPVRRVLLGHSADGRGVVLDDGLAVSTIRPGLPDFVFTEVAGTEASPAPIRREWSWAAPENRRVAPPPRGSVFRIVDHPPETEELLRSLDTRALEEVSAPAQSPHPLMHQTETVDYAIVLSGQMYLVLEDTEILLRTGDVVVNPGVKHAWSNRGNVNCRMAFILIDGEFEPALKGGTLPYPQDQ